MHRLPEQGGTWGEFGKHWVPTPSPSQRSRHPRMHGPKPDLASNGGTSPLRSENWYHSQQDRWATGRRPQWRGGGKGDVSPAWGREVAWTCQLHIGDVSEYASATWPIYVIRQWSKRTSFSELGQHIQPVSIRSGRQMPRIVQVYCTYSTEPYGNSTTVACQ